MELLRPTLARILAERGKVATVGADQFIYFREGDASRRIAPDVYVLPGVKPGTRIKSWKVWHEGFAPSFCFEVVSEDVRYDYEEKPILYGEMGTRELIVFDPESEGQPERYRWQVFRRVKGRGFVRVAISQADRVRSKELRLWLRHVGEGANMRVLPALGDDGDDLVQTAEERAQSERAEKEHERAEKEHERAEKEHERAERLQAQLEVERLKAELLALKGAPSRTTVAKPRSPANKKRRP